jgi:hypothetical protein
MYTSVLNGLDIFHFAEGYFTGNIHSGFSALVSKIDTGSRTHGNVRVEDAVNEDARGAMSWWSMTRMYAGHH